MIKYIFNEVSTMFFAVLLLFLVLATKANSEEMKVMCYIEDMGTGFPCIQNENDEFYWGGYWHTGYNVQFAYTSDYGIQYVSLVHKEK